MARGVSGSRAELSAELLTTLDTIVRQSDGASGTLPEWIDDNAEDPDFCDFLRDLEQEGAGAAAIWCGGAGGNDVFRVTGGAS